LTPSINADSNAGKTYRLGVIETARYLEYPAFILWTYQYLE